MAAKCQLFECLGCKEPAVHLDFFKIFFVILHFLDFCLRDPACQLHGGLFNPALPTARNANPGTKTLRTAAPQRIYCDAQKCMKSQHWEAFNMLKSQQKGIGRHITCCKVYTCFTLGQRLQYILCRYNILMRGISLKKRKSFKQP